MQYDLLKSSVIRFNGIPKCFTYKAYSKKRFFQFPAKSNNGSSALAIQVAHFENNAFTFFQACFETSFTCFHFIFSKLIHHYFGRFKLFKWNLCMNGGVKVARAYPLNFYDSLIHFGFVDLSKSFTRVNVWSIQFG